METLGLSAGDCEDFAIAKYFTLLINIPNEKMRLAITLSTLLALLGGLLASTLNARSYLNEQLSSKNTHNATALALSQQNANPVMIELTVWALFDGGHYDLIRVVNPLGKTIAEKSAPASTLTVPAWFVAVLPLNYSADNQIFLTDLASFAHKMGLQVYADGVIDRAALAALETVGFDGVAGPAVKEPTSINPY